MEEYIYDPKCYTLDADKIFGNFSSLINYGIPKPYFYDE
jgi:hypothetical protein